MDFLVSEVDKGPIVTETILDETYPGLTVFEMTDAQREAVKNAKNITSHLSPMTSEDENEEYISSDEENDDSTEVSDVEEIVDKDTVDEKIVNTLNQTHEQTVSEDKVISSIIDTLPTPHVLSKIPEDAILEELKEEVTKLRKKVALSFNMKSLMNKLDGGQDTTFYIEVIKKYSKRRFNIEISNDDFDALTQEQVINLYKKTRESEKSDKFELIYKTVFDFGINCLNKFLNDYIMKVEDLNNYILYEDICDDLIDIKSMFENTIVGSYVGNTSPIIRIVSHIFIQVTRAKLKV